MKANFGNYTLRAAVVALSVVLWMLCGCAPGEKQTPHPAVTTAATEETLPTETTLPVLEEGVVAHNGKYYRLREDQLRILVMGLDKRNRTESDSGYTNKMQSDFLLLVVMDEDTKECNILNLNRDTMTPIQRLGFGGSVSGVYTAQLALAHTYGRGGEDSARNVMQAVSNLLGGVPIDHYMSLTMSSISKLNDLVGGVTVTILEDFTAEDPALIEGREVTLTGKQALTYVHGRKNIGDGTNLGRMDRQEQYLYAFYHQFLEASRTGGVDFLTRVLMTVGTSFRSDLDFDALNQLRELLPSCKINPFQSLEGELVMGEEFHEYYVDEEALQEQVISLFYEEIPLEEARRK